MKSLKMAFAAIGLTALLAVLIVGLGGGLLSRNLDTVADAAVDASGIREKMAKEESDRCRLARQQYESMWNDAVDNDSFEAREAALNHAEATMKVTCSPN